VTNPKGTKLETATVNWLRAHGWTFARRIVKEGSRDKGDVILGDGIPVTIEAKNTKAINLAGGQKELAVEMENAGNRWGFTIHKKRGTTDVGKYYAVLPVEVLNDILHAALEHTGQDVPLRQAKSKAKDNALATEEFVPRKRIIPRR
jgi:hypothetical protein